MEKRRLRITVSGPRVRPYRGRTLYSINSTVPLAAFHLLGILCVCIAAHLLQQTKASSALLGTADLPSSRKFLPHMGTPPSYPTALSHSADQIRLLHQVSISIH